MAPDSERPAIRRLREARASVITIASEQQTLRPFVAGAPMPLPVLSRRSPMLNAQIKAKRDLSTARVRLKAPRRRVRTHNESHRAKCVRLLCQNCVTYPPKPWGNTVIYGNTSTHIEVAEVVESELR
jgi:hypothetical protein